ncbi:hypothetical protein [Streptomyces kanamyceticus]|uniref:hypothetical protein n=1 Tax=Streptomyces kanamyceticus TaxID=1967 RepID=UPI0037DCF24A
MAAVATVTGVTLLSGIFIAGPAEAMSVPKCKKWSSSGGHKANVKCGFTNAPNFYKYRIVAHCTGHGEIHGKWVSPIPRNKYGKTSSAKCAGKVRHLEREFARA